MENINEEQPLSEAKNEQDVSCGVDGMEVNTLNGGSSIGKFKTTEALVNAYNNLQAEFTRRCQRIKSLEKQLENTTSANEILQESCNFKGNESANQEANVVDDNFSAEVQEINKEMYDTASNEDAPSYLKDDYNQKLINFLSENKDAKKYAKEIGEEILNDKSLTLQSAYDRVLAKKFVAPSELVKDEQFINNFILSNEEILKDIIKKYKSEEKVLPTIIQNNSNASIAQAYPVEVKTIKEAGELAKKLLS